MIVRPIFAEVQTCLHGDTLLGEAPCDRCVEWGLTTEVEATTATRAAVQYRRLPWTIRRRLACAGVPALPGCRFRGAPVYARAAVDAAMTGKPVPAVPLPRVSDMLGRPDTDA